MRAILIKAVLVAALAFAAYFLSANAEDDVEAQTMPALFMDCWSMKKTHTADECTAEAYRNR